MSDLTTSMESWARKHGTKWESIAIEARGSKWEPILIEANTWYCTVDDKFECELSKDTTSRSEDVYRVVVEWPGIPVAKNIFFSYLEALEWLENYLECRN